MGYFEELSALVDKRKQEWCDLSDRIWEYAESRFQEFKSVEDQIKIMKEHGFSITENVSGAKTAFIAEYGKGKPVIGFLGEYDALSGLSQKADCTEMDPLVPGGDGHGCGHHLLGVGNLAAVVALKEYMEKEGMEGTVRYYGCPAEENAGGKAFLVRDGVFDDCDFCLTWHAAATNYVNTTGCLANFRVFFTFHGRSSHAASNPHLGRSALDAVELMNVGVNYMREHMIDQARIHYAVTDSGGTAPNVVQARAQVLYAIRAPKVTQVKELYERVCDVARGAALMTGTQVEIRHVAAYSDYIGNDVMQDLLRKNINKFLPIEYTEEELGYAKGFQAVLGDLDRQALERNAKKYAGKDYKALLDQPMWNFLAPDVSSRGSSDVGDVSWVTPTAWFHIATWAAGTPGHNWRVVAQGKSSLAHKGMMVAAKVLAITAMDMMKNPLLIQKAKIDWEEKREGEVYPGALPADAKPEIW